MKIGVYITEILEEIYEGIKKAVNKEKIKTQSINNYEIFKWHEYYKLMVQWLQIKDQGINLTEYLREQGYNRVALYGIGDIGKLCYDEIIASEDINIVNVIDMVAQGDYKGCSIIRPEHLSSNIDAIIVTPIYCYYGIAEMLCKLTTAKLISLEDIVAVLNGRVRA